MTPRSTRIVLAVFCAAVLLLSISAFADSQARIVRLSDIQGDVQIDRHIGQGLEKAILNMPITQDMVLSTGADGRAEVEFEDGSIIHLAPHSELVFQELYLRSAGDKISTVAVERGTAYFNVERKDDDEFTIVAADQRIPVRKSSRVRLTVGSDEVKVAVFRGELELGIRGENVKVRKGQELALRLSDSSTYLAKDIPPNEFDRWDKERTESHDRYYANSSYRSYPYYGRSDLGLYGGWYDVPGFGSMWRPYDVGLGWDPFSNGYWAWYPGAGYTWVSNYRWGWLPFRYGSWQFVPGFGWYWAPQGGWRHWTPQPRIINPPGGFRGPQPPVTRVPKPPTILVPRPPRIDRDSDIVVGGRARRGTMLPGTDDGPRLVRPPKVTDAPAVETWRGRDVPRIRPDRPTGIGGTRTTPSVDRPSGTRTPSAPATPSRTVSAPMAPAPRSMSPPPAPRVERSAPSSSRGPESMGRRGE